MLPKLFSLKEGKNLDNQLLNSFPYKICAIKLASARQGDKKSVPDGS